jgi:hypothetical protein
MIVLSLGTKVYVDNGGRRLAISTSAGNIYDNQHTLHRAARNFLLLLKYRHSSKKYQCHFFSSIFSIIPTGVNF